jgi:hypothetical protein
VPNGTPFKKSLTIRMEGHRQGSLRHSESEQRAASEAGPEVQTAAVPEPAVEEPLSAAEPSSAVQASAELRVELLAEPVLQTAVEPIAVA